MKLNTRQLKLYSLLISQQKPLTVAYFAQYLLVSKRTIHNDLKIVETILNQNGFNLQKTPGIGIQAIKHKTKTNPLNPQFDIQYTPTQRQVKILETLLFAEKKVTLESLASLFFVSKSSIVIDLKKIEVQYLEKVDVKLISDKKGTCLQGDETAIRKLLIILNQALYQLLFEENQGAYEKYLKVKYGEDCVRDCLAVIDQLEHSNIEVIAEHYKHNLIDILIVMTTRCQKGYRIIENKKDLVVNEIQQMVYVLLAKDILSRLSSHQVVNYSEADYNFLAQYLIANRINFKQTSSLGSDKLVNIVDEILHKIGSALDLDFSQDEQLKKQLLSHVQSMIYRLQHKINIRNNLIEEIKEEFRVLYDVIWIVLNDIFEDLGWKLTEDEVGFFLIYIQTGIDRVKKSKRVLIVCPNGISTSQLISSRIRALLPPLDIIEASSIDTALEADLKQIDFIISTVPLEIKNKQVIVVSPLLSETDILKISQYYNQEFILRNESQYPQSFQSLLDYIDQDFILFSDHEETKEEVIDTMCQHLMKKGAITQEYQLAIVDRESKGSTELNSGAAIPHGNLKYVKKTSLGLMILQKPLKWDNVSVRVIAFPCIHANDTRIVRGLFRELYHLLNDRKQIENLSRLKNANEVLALLKGEYIHD